MCPTPNLYLITTTSHTEVQRSVKDIKEAAKAAAKTHKSLEAKLKKGWCNFLSFMHVVIEP